MHNTPITGEPRLTDTEGVSSASSCCGSVVSRCLELCFFYGTERRQSKVRREEGGREEGGREECDSEGGGGSVRGRDVGGRLWGVGRRCTRKETERYGMEVGKFGSGKL